MELMSVVFRLAGLARYTEASTPYAKAVDAHFAFVRDHRAVRFTRELGTRYGFGHEMAPRMGAYLDDTFHLQVPASPLPTDLARWKDADLGIYLDAIRDFATQGKFADFMVEQRSYLEAVAARDRAFFDRVRFVDWFDGTFGARPAAHYHLAPGLLTGPMDYAVHAELPNDGEQVFVVAHLDAPDPAGLPAPTDAALPFVAHELCHTYTNPIVDHALADLSASSKAIEPTRPRLAAQGYTTDAIVLEESVVRAIVVLWSRDELGPASGDAEISAQERLGFPWTRALADSLEAARKAGGGKLSAEALVTATRDAVR